jgi:formylmethanofuran dehydrogenase subunit A
MKLTRQEINQHNNQQSCWVAIHGAVYDVTGREIIVLEGPTTPGSLLKTFWTPTQVVQL